tara:strand:- start:2031 stop:3980 length:1950 start_codon:yes stop_codon:yes gene_type:complete
VTKKVAIDIVARDKTKAALNGVNKGLSKLKGQVFNLRNAFAGLGLALVGREFLNTSRSVEQLRVRFKFLFGSAHEGAKAFDNLTTFAAKVPFSLEEIAGASGSLAVVAKDAEDLNRVLEITGNVAAVTGLDFRTTAEQIQRSFAGGIGAADLFRERGVRALLGFQAGAKVSIEETVEAFERDFSGDGRFGKATLSLAQTFDGTLSMLGDKFFKFKLAVMDSDPFDFLKVAFSQIDKFIESNFNSIEEFAMVVGGNIVKIAKQMILFGAASADLLAPIFREVKASVTNLIKIFNSLPAVAQSLGLIGLLFLGRKGLAGIIALDFALRKIGQFTGLSDVFKDATKDIKGFNKEAIELDEILAKPLDERSFLEQAKVVIAALEGQMREARKNSEDLDNIISDLGKTSKTFSERLGDVNKRLKSTFKDAITSADKAVKSFTDAIARAIVTGQSMGEVFKNVGIQILTFFISAILEAVIMALFLRDILDAIEERLGKQESASDKASKSLRSLARSTALASASQALFGQQTANTNRELERQNQLQGAQAGAAVGSIFGPVGTIIGGILGGGLFADGGRPPIGKASIVGEKGAEVFVPDSAGTIIPNNELGGVTNVTFNINTVDQRGFAELLDGRRGQIINMVNTALNNKGRTALV